MWSDPIRIGEYYDSPPVTASGILAPRAPGVYVASLKRFPPSSGPSVEHDVLYVGTTLKGAQPELLYRVSGLVFDALGYTCEGDEEDSEFAYFHSGGRKIWLYCKRESIDPREIFLAWQTVRDCCGAWEELRLFELFKRRPPFLNLRKPPGCVDPQHSHSR